MQARFSILSLFAASLVTLAGFSATPGFATEGVVTSSSLEMITPVAAANSVETHEFHLRNARIPSLQSSRQNVTAWQVDHGSWNGQTLNGLSVVLVQSVSEGGMPARLTNCYVSHEATPAQRTALVDAFLADNSQSLSPEELSEMRIEPAVIRLEIAGQTVILHLGLIA